jgi:hypothetical protein
MATTVCPKGTVQLAVEFRAKFEEGVVALTNSEPSIARELRRAMRSGKLKLTGRGLTALPPEVSQLTNLRTLDLAGNHLTSLPPEIGQLADLQTLLLRNNHLTALPPEIGQLAGLQTLDVSFNRLTTLPPALGSLLTGGWLARNFSRALSIDMTHNPLRGRIRKLHGRALGAYLRSLDKSGRQAVTLGRWSSADLRTFIITIVGTFVANVLTLLYVGLALSVSRRATTLKVATGVAAELTVEWLGFMAFAVIFIWLGKHFVAPLPRFVVLFMKIVLWLSIASLFWLALFWVAKASGIK